jgi:hypothetical protein
MTAVKIARAALAGLCAVLVGTAQAQPTKDVCEQAKAATQSNTQVLTTRIQCLLSGVEPAERPVEQARQLAREAHTQGDPAASFLLYLVYANDPAFTYIRNGKADMAQYQRLASLPVSQRAEQIEALDALAFAISKGHVNASLIAATYLFETSAPDNTKRLAGLTGLLQRNAIKSPLVQRYGEAAVNALRYGGTHASAKAFNDALTSATQGAHLIFARANNGRDCPEMRLVTTTPGELKDAEFLPLTSRMFMNTYLLRGSWTERWVFSGCDQEVPTEVMFTADGWGGASFAVSVQPQKK